MDKNTIWAIVLSTLVIIGSYFLLPKIFGNKKTNDAEQTSVEVVADNSVTDGQTSQTDILSETLFDEETSALLAEAEAVEEEAFEDEALPETEEPAEASVEEEAPAETPATEAPAEEAPADEAAPASEE